MNIRFPIFGFRFSIFNRGSSIVNPQFGCSEVLGLIAGGGRLPFLVAGGAKQSGLRVICVGLAGMAEHRLAGEVDVFYRVGLARPGSWIRKLRKHGVSKTVMVGQVAKSQLFTPR